MTVSFFEEYMTDANANDGDEIDEQKVTANALIPVIKSIIENELTEKQRVCFELFFIHKKTQCEIASIIRLSQPSVSKHIKAAQNIVKKISTYCLKAVENANSQWINAL